MAGRERGGWRGVAGGGRGVLALLLSAVAVHGVLAWLAREPGILTGQDDAIYVALARSIRQGGYQELFRVGTPPHAQYPPFYPALIAVWGGVFGDGFDALTALNVLLSAAALVLVYVALKRRVGETVAVLTAAVLAVNPHLVGAAGAVLSEAPYLFLTVLALAVLSREKVSARGALAAGLLALAAALTRSAGVTILAALVLYWWLEPRRRAAVALGVAALVIVGGWLAWTVLAPEKYVGSSYVADLGASRRVPFVAPFPQRIPGNIAWYLRVAVPWTLAVPTVRGTLVDNAVALGLLTLTGGAGLVVFARRWRAGLLYALAYGGLLASWVWRIERFAVPVLFLVVAAMLAGAQAIGSRLSRRRWAGAALAGAIAAVLLVSGAVRSVRLVSERATCHRAEDGIPEGPCLLADQVSFFEAARWIRARTPPDAVVLAAKAASLWYHTGRLTAGYRASLDQDAGGFLPYLREQGADYILLGSLHIYEPRALLDRVEANCARLTVAGFFAPRTWLFSIEPPASAGEADESCRAAAEYRERNRNRDFERNP
jgi:hypothetical protein